MISQGFAPLLVRPRCSCHNGGEWQGVSVGRGGAGPLQGRATWYLEGLEIWPLGAYIPTLLTQICKSRIQGHKLPEAAEVALHLNAIPMHSPAQPSTALRSAVQCSAAQ